MQKVITNSFTELLLILFIGLKLTNHLQWNWLWVLSPFWVPIVTLAILQFGINLLKKNSWGKK